jgi:hypothetical protein
MEFLRLTEAAMSTDCKTGLVNPAAPKQAISRLRRLIGIGIAIVVVPLFAAAVCWFSQRETVIVVEVDQDLSGQYELELTQGPTFRACQENATFVFSRAGRYEVRVKPGRYCATIHRRFYRSSIYASSPESDLVVRPEPSPGFGRQCLSVTTCFRVVPGETKHLDLSQEYPY